MACKRGKGVEVLHCYGDQVIHTFFKNGGSSHLTKKLRDSSYILLTFDDIHF